MMTGMWIIACIIAGVFIMAYLHERKVARDARRQSVRIIAELHKKLDLSRKACAAWEQGIEDTTENYEQQFLSLGDQINALTNGLEYYRELAASLAAEVYVHRERCLPILEMTDLIQKIKTMDEDELWAEILTGE